jgi:hypothetical protein
MRNNKVKYIGFYDSGLYSNENRNSFLAATSKMDYIAEAIVASGNSVDIISPSWTTNNKGYYPKRTTILSKGITLTCGSTFGANFRLFRYLRILWSWIWLLGFLLKNTHKNEQVIVYHSMMIMEPIILAKKIKEFKLILEVEEIYQDAKEFTKGMKNKEYNIFKLADKFIFPTELLNDAINTNNRPYTIIHGTYKVQKDRSYKLNQGCIHAVYAGTFDSRKGGALAAITAAAYLPQNYHMHIIGFGTKEEMKLIQDTIEKVSKESNSTITYDGLLKDEDYIQFLQKCDIGLSTQNPDDMYNETSFPSKILSYMANGLRVVTVRIKVIEKSAIGDKVFYYQGQDPEAIAKAILSIDLKKTYDSRRIIRKLNKEFIKNIRALIES